MVNFKDLRKNSGFSVDELAKKLGVSKWTVYAWEEGRSTPRLKWIEKLSELLGVTESVIIAAFQK